MPLKNIRQRKNELRKKYKKLRAECPPDVKQNLDVRLSDNFFELDEYKKSRVIFTFISSAIETDTSLIISRAFSDGKLVAVPKCRDKSGIMDFFYIESYDDLEKGMFSIPEPKDGCSQAKDFSDGLCIVPGLCYDLLGYRLGFGKGYYDRFLEKFGGTSVGICYSKCVERELPRGNFDKPVDILVTEKFINYTHNMFGGGMI